MADVKMVSFYDTVDATAITSASDSYTVSAMEKDEYVNIVIVTPATLSGTATILMGDYPNGDSSLSGTDSTEIALAASKCTVIAGLDGSKYRNTDAQCDIKLSLTGAGTAQIYTFAPKFGL